MKHLTIFEDTEAFGEEKDNLDLPNVSYIEDDGSVEYLAAGVSPAPPSKILLASESDQALNVSDWTVFYSSEGALPLKAVVRHVAPDESYVDIMTPTSNDSFYCYNAVILSAFNELEVSSPATPKSLRQDELVDMEAYVSEVVGYDFGAVIKVNNPPPIESLIGWFEV